MDTKGLETLLAVALVAALAPMIVAALPGPRIPQVVILILAGILIGPHVLGLADTSSIRLLANVGLGFLFLLAGYELDPRLLRERPGRLAIGGWVLSAVLAVGRGGRARLARLRARLRAGRAGPDHHRAGHAAADPARQRHAVGPVRPRTCWPPERSGELFPIVAISLFLTQPRRVHRARLDRWPSAWSRSC